MPMDIGSLTPIIKSSLISGGISGPSLPQLTDGLATGLSIYATTTIRVQSIDTGTVGAGTGFGFGITVPPAIIASMNGSFIASLLIGPNNSNLATAVANAFIQSFAVATVNTISPGVGIGTGLAFMVPVPAISTGIFLSSLTSSGISGPSVFQLASAVSIGLDIVLPLSTSILAIVGAPGPSAASSSGFGKIS